MCLPSWIGCFRRGIIHVHHYHVGVASVVVLAVGAPRLVGASQLAATVGVAALQLAATVGVDALQLASAGCVGFRVRFLAGALRFV